ncbi:MAG: TolC family protein [Defluviitaleaceae bacterium]|nr:TolC family protein [Defluviitaleaceae bacterium]
MKNTNLPNMAKEFLKGLLLGTFVTLVLVGLMLASVLNVHAAQSRVVEIEYSNALSRAISRNPDTSPLDLEARRAAARARANLAEFLALTGSGDYREQAEAAYGQRLINLAESNRLQGELARIAASTELALRNHIANIARQESQIANLTLNLDINERMLEQTLLRHQHGMASTAEITDAELALEQTHLNLATLQLQLANERQSLNRLIHHTITQNTQIIYDVHDIPPITAEMRTDRLISRQTNSYPTVQHWQDQVEVRRFEWQRQLNDPRVDNAQMRLQLDLAHIELNMAETLAELGIRNLFAEWDRLLEQENSLQMALAQAQSDYADMQERFAAGLVTEIQVEMLALAVTMRETELALHDYNFWIARFRIEHPYAR